MTMRLLILAALTVGTEGSAQQCSHTPTLDKLEQTTGLQLKPTLIPVYGGSGGGLYNPGQPLLYSSGGSTALCATFTLMALYASSKGHPVSGDCASNSPFIDSDPPGLSANGKEMRAADDYEQRLQKK